MEVPTDASEILDPESEACSVIASTTKAFWSVATDYSSAPTSDKSASKINKAGNGNPAKAGDLIAILVVFISFIVGLVFYVIRKE